MTSHVGCKSPLWAISLVITPACLYTLGMVYWVLLIGRIHRTPHFSYLILLSFISRSYSSIKLSCSENLSVYLMFSFSSIPYVFSKKLLFCFRIKSIIFTMLIITPIGLAWDQLWSYVPCTHLGGNSRRYKTRYQRNRFKRPRKSEKPHLV